MRHKFTCKGYLFSRARLCDPMDCSPPGSSVHGIFQSRMLELVAISLSRDLPNSEIKPGSPALQANSVLTELQMGFLK